MNVTYKNSSSKCLKKKKTSLILKKYYIKKIMLDQVVNLFDVKILWDNLYKSFFFLYFCSLIVVFNLYIIFFNLLIVKNESVVLKILKIYLPPFLIVVSEVALKAAKKKGFFEG